MEHIKTPVRIGGHDAGDYISIQEADGSYKQTMQGMAEIVVAVNTHDALIEACEALVEAEDFEDSELLRRAVEYARTALALAKGVK